MSIAPIDTTPPAGSTSPFPYPFDKLEPQFIVTVVDQTGLFEVLSETDQGQWLLRALNDDKLRIMTVVARDVRGFDLPIYHCFASRTRGEIVALVNGDEYEVTHDEDAEEAAELFQAAHATELAKFCDLAWAAGFTNIELTNGYDAWEGTIEELLGECRAFNSPQTSPA